MANREANRLNLNFRARFKTGWAGGYKGLLGNSIGN
jgi:hypothetical protein